MHLWGRQEISFIIVVLETWTYNKPYRMLEDLLRDFSCNTRIDNLEMQSMRPLDPRGSYCIYQLQLELQQTELKVTHHWLWGLVFAEPQIATNLKTYDRTSGMYHLGQLRLSEQPFNHLGIHICPVITLRPMAIRRSTSMFFFNYQWRKITCCAPIENPITQNIFEIPKTLVITACWARLRRVLIESDSTNEIRSYILSSYETLGKYGPL